MLSVGASVCTKRSWEGKWRLASPGSCWWGTIRFHRCRWRIGGLCCGQQVSEECSINHITLYEIVNVRSHVYIKYTRREYDIMFSDKLTPMCYDMNIWVKSPWRCTEGKEHFEINWRILAQVCGSSVRIANSYMLPHKQICPTHVVFSMTVPDILEEKQSKIWWEEVIRSTLISRNSCYR